MENSFYIETEPGVMSLVLFYQLNIYNSPYM